MADDEVDLSQYSPEQQTAIQQYSSVTNQNLAEALPLLERCQWNVEVREQFVGALQRARS
jgi:FAS-associated factor 2